jgi:hypothetical protein
MDGGACSRKRSDSRAIQNKRPTTTESHHLAASRVSGAKKKHCTKRFLVTPYVIHIRTAVHADQILLLCMPLQVAPHHQWTLIDVRRDSTEKAMHPLSNFPPKVLLLALDLLRSQKFER